MEEELKQQPQKQESQEMEKEDMTVEEKSKLSNYKYKVFLGFLRILPMVIAGLFLLNTVLSYFYIDWTIFSYLASVGFIPWLFIMIASYLFHFCEYHRMFLWYIMVNNILCWADYEFTLPISNRDYFLLHIIVAGVFLFFILYLHQKEVKRRRNLKEI